MIKRTLLISAIATLCALSLNAGEWQVSVNNKRVSLRTIKTQASVKPWQYGSVEIRGGEKITVTAPDGSTESFTANGPFKKIYDRDSRRDVMVLFGDPPDGNIPDRSDPKVKWYGPGEHEAGPIRLKDGETLYLAPGAVVHGALYASGSNITVTGRGTLTGDRYGKCKGPFVFFSYFKGCTNLTVRGIVFAEPYHWTCAVGNCDTALFDNVKVCAANVINDDSFDIFNSRNITIRNSFMRSQDDNIALKGLGPLPRTSRPATENITIEDSILWTDRASNFRIGFECNAERFSNIVARNLDIHGYAIDYRPSEKFWANPAFLIEPSGGMPIENCLFENIRVRCDGISNSLIVANPRRCWTFDPDAIATDAVYASTTKIRDTCCGTISNLVFRNVSLEGKKPGMPAEIYIRGASEKEYVKDVRFENVTRFGEDVWADSPAVRIGPFAEGVTFGDPNNRSEFLRQLLLSSDTNYVFVTAHRMDWRNHPENSLSGALSAIEMGVDILELDPAVTRDGRIVLMHDATLDRTTDAPTNIAPRTSIFHSICSYRLKENQGGKDARVTGERIATLEDVLAAAKGKCLVNIDKFADQIVPLMSEIRRLGMERYVICKSAIGYSDLRKEARHTWQWIEDGTFIYFPIVSISSDETRLKDIREFVYDGNRAPIGVEVTLRGSNATAFISDLKNLKRPPRIWLNTMWERHNNGHCHDTSGGNHVDGWNWCLGRGATILQTDRPKELIAHLQSIGRRKTENAK